MNSSDAIATAKEVIACEARGLNELEKSIDGNFVKAVEAISEVTGRVIITGVGKSGHVGRKIAATMASTGTPAFFVHPAEASHGDLGMLTDKDLVVAISKSGESKELSDVIMFCKRFGITLIGMAQKADSTLLKNSDIVLLLPDVPEAQPFGFVPTTSTTNTMALGDALAMVLIRKKNFSQDQFKDRHPGGKLGKSLIRVSDLMHTGDKLPLISVNTIMKETLEEIVAKGLGVVGVINDEGNLKGIITDGDLKRKMTNNFLDRKTSEVMTENPKTISKDLLGVEALAVMNSMKITTLFIVENSKPIGIIHIHDCLKAGLG